MRLSFTILFLILVLPIIASCADQIRITAVVDRQEYQMTLTLSIHPSSPLVTFTEDLIRQISRSFDLLIARRDWKLQMTRVHGRNKDNERVKLLGVVHGVQYGLKEALLAIGYPPELPTPIFPVVHVDDSRKVTEYQLVSRDWRRYLKSKSLDTLDRLYRVTPFTHNIHISMSEHDTIVNMFKPGKVVKVKAGAELHIEMAHLFTVTTVDYRDRLVNLTANTENDTLSQFMDSGLDREEAEEAYLCMQTIGKRSCF